MNAVKINYNLSGLAVAALQDRPGAAAAYDAARISFENDLQALFEKVLAGAVISYKTGCNLYIYSPSIRPGVKVQRSCFGLIRGEWEALSHADINDAKSFIEHATDNVIYKIEE